MAVSDAMNTSDVLGIATRPYQKSSAFPHESKGSLNNKVYKMSNPRYPVARERLYEDGDTGTGSGERTAVAARAGHVE